ncbi:MAG: ribosome maturation factor RimP [Desulfatibacillum sp.]|nr:ribosome maturation factor RimP [Desulfatibacillum sp.]
MDSDKILSQVKSLTEAALAAEGMDLVLAEFKRDGGGYILRLFVDKEGGITLGDCTMVSRYVGDLLDAYADEMPRYRLEVSSPGLDRPLTREDHYRRFEGRTALIVTKELRDGRRKFRGILSGASNGVITLVAEDVSMEFTLQEIESARLQYQHGESTC